MSGQRFRDPSNISMEEAAALVADATDAFEKADVERILTFYSDDVKINYGSYPEMTGIDQARRWLESRFAKQQNYRLNKRVVNVMGNIIGTCWEGWWDDAETGRKMQCRAAEFITIDSDGRACELYAAVTAWPVEQ